MASRRRCGAVESEISLGASAVIAIIVAADHNLPELPLSFCKFNLQFQKIERSMP